MPPSRREILDAKSESKREIDAFVGRRIRMRREALGISQTRLGEHLGITFSGVQKYERGLNRIGAGSLYQIASFLGVPVSYFFRGLEDSGATPNDDITDLVELFESIPDLPLRASILALMRASIPGERRELVDATNEEMGTNRPR